MNSELNRLATFSKLPENSTINPYAFARSGFFYCGQRDEVECFSCKLRLSNWERSENPNERHRNCSPLCHVVLETDIEKRPLKSPSPILDVVDASAVATDNAQVEELGVLSTLIKPACQRANANSIFLHSNVDRSKPDYELLRNEEARLSTFYDWPSVAHTDPRVLAKEGLFYTGSDDEVQCVFCREYLRNWEPADVPAVEHRRLFPNCPFVLRQNVGSVPFRRVDTLAVDVLGGGRLGKENEDRSTGEILKPEQNEIPSVIDSYGIKQREVKAIMEKSTVRAILDIKGYALDKVKAVIETRLSTTVSAGATSSGLASESVNNSMFNNSSPPHVTASPNHSVETKHYLEENRQLREARLCRVCIGADVDTVILACGHLVCHQCSMRLQNCPICRNSVCRTTKAAAGQLTYDDPPKYPEYCDVSCRIRSFNGQDALLYRAEKFANAGWFYVGPGDKLLCFQCGGNLKYWEPEDDPWKEHRRFYSHCPYIKTRRPSERPRDLETQCPMPAAAVATGMYRIKLREVKARMDTPTVRTILKTGNSKDLIRSADEPRPTTSAKKRNKKRNQDPVISASTVNAAVEETQTVHKKDAASDEQNLGELPDEESIKYLKENRQLREQITCMECMYAEVDMLFLPCGHLVCCATCSPYLSNCPICRTFIQQRVKTFLS